MNRVILIIWNMMKKYSLTLRHFWNLTINTIMTHNMNNSYSCSRLRRVNNIKQNRKHAIYNFCKRMTMIWSNATLFRLLMMLILLSILMLLSLLLLLTRFRFSRWICRFRIRRICLMISSKQFCFRCRNSYTNFSFSRFRFRTNNVTICFHERT